MNESEKSEPAASIEEELKALQYKLADIDFWDAGDPNIVRLIVFELAEMNVRMDGNKNHKRPHIHIEYGTDPHAASYAIDTGQRLAGRLKSKHDRAVREWIGECKPKLLEIWNTTQAGKDPHPLIWALRGVME
jgi:hypothetical protein